MQHEAPTVTQTIQNLKQMRQRMAGNRNTLVAAAAQFEHELDRCLRAVLNEVDPVSGRPFITLEPVADVPWGSRLLLYNKHRIEFLIESDGTFRSRTTFGPGEVFPGGFSSPVPGQS